MALLDRWLKKVLKPDEAAPPDPPPRLVDPTLAPLARDTGTHAAEDVRGSRGDVALPADPLDATIARARARLTADQSGRAWAESPDFLMELSALDAGGRGKAADELLADALLCTPSLGLRRMLAERLLFRGDRSRARSLLERLAEAEEHAPFALCALGESAEAAGDVDLAVTCYERVLALDITHATAKTRARRLRSGREERGRDDGRAALARFVGARAAGARYAVLDEIGRGGAATVFRARDRVVGREVALKIFHPRGSAAERRARIVEEARIAGAFDHPHIVPVLDLDEQRDLLVMVLCDGGSLQRRIQQQGKLRTSEAVELGAVLLRTLADIHDAGQLHLDVKPSNLLFHEGQLMLCDFGTAGIFGLGAVAGTRAYMAPEQLAGARVGNATDLWAAGLVVAESLEGHLPGRGGIALPTLPQGPRRRGLERVLSLLSDPRIDHRPQDGRAAAELLLEAGALPLADKDGAQLLAHIEMLARREGEAALARLQEHPLIAALRT